MQYILKIKDLEIPLNIKNYKTAKTMKIFFKNGELVATKSPYIPKRELDSFIKKNEENIYNEYKKILEKNKNKKEIWQDGEKILYHGEEYEINLQYHEKNIISVRIEMQEKKFLIILPKIIKKEEINENVKRALRNLFKNNTEAILDERLPYWSNITKIKYSSMQVRDAKTKYGSCVPKTKALHFSSRLVMLKQEAIDAVIVHELCHIVHPNHSKDFYKLVKTYIQNYDELDKYLKEKSAQIQMF